MFNLPALLIFVLLPTKQHDHAMANYIQPCSGPLQSLVLWLHYGLLLWGGSSFLSLGSWQFHEHESFGFCAPQQPLVPLSVSFYEEFISYRSLFKELLKFISVFFCKSVCESSANLSYWLRSAFAVNLVAVYLPTSLV